MLFCDTFALRGYDSVQFAAAAEAAEIKGTEIGFAYNTGVVFVKFIGTHAE